ncbi:ABC transporter [Micromonospora auratinigra]|uniref:ABC transporter n=1 Tax=Micromonospora auratinigra TaxID=261654 RepID=A0A1A9A5K1_9ACTN|nr:ABC transporter [Micromonospora auratinigra]
MPGSCQGGDRPAAHGGRMTSSAIAVSGLRKAYKDKVVLDGIDLDVRAGTVFSLLGPNGARKTTTVNVLTTLVRADGRSVRVAGHDVTTEARAVRSAIGVTGQFAAVDELLTGRENLQLMVDLSGLRATDGKRVIGGLLERFELTESADKPASTYSPTGSRYSTRGVSSPREPPTSSSGRSPGRTSGSGSPPSPNSTRPRGSSPGRSATTKPWPCGFPAMAGRRRRGPCWTGSTSTRSAPRSSPYRPPTSMTSSST